MTEREDDERPKPWDPAGTQPKHDPEELLPVNAEPLLPPDAEVVDSDAVDADGGDLLPERRAAAGAHAVAAAPGGSSYAPRFHFLTGALMAVALAAIIGIVVLVIGPSTQGPGPVWSPWKPASSGTDGAAQIAGYVGGEYRDAGEQLFKVEANDLSFRGVRLVVALHQSAQQGGDIQIHDDKGVLYQMCGLGENCSIDHGKPSKERTLVLRRAALELALYSFHYLKVKQVVVLIPPPPGKLQTVALYFREDDVKPELDRPLTASLVPRAPSPGTVALSPDIGLVKQETSTSYVFTLMGSSFNDRGFLVLDPYTPELDRQTQKRLRQQAAQAAAAAAGAVTGG
jgi:hypothetical protein